MSVVNQGVMFEVWITVDLFALHVRDIKSRNALVDEVSVRMSSGSAWNAASSIALVRPCTVQGEKNICPARAGVTPACTLMVATQADKFVDSDDMTIAFVPCWQVSS